MAAMMDSDVIIVGSGPAGVSAAFPMLEAGLRVLMVDGGRHVQRSLPHGAYLAERAGDPNSSDWMVGNDFYALQNANAISPKMRVPIHSYVFEGFLAENRICPKDFIAIGSMAQGGLSNAWGCGVARLSDQEMKAFPFPRKELDTSYETVARRIGISGAVADDMSDYFGLDSWAQSPIQMDALQSRILRRYQTKAKKMQANGLRMGRSRVAVLAEDQEERKGCDLSGTCLWGCRRRALYSATEDLALLKGYSNFHYRSGFVVDEVLANGRLSGVRGQDVGGPAQMTARKTVLAAGTLASTRLALQAIGYERSVPMQACPTAAFIVWLPELLGRRRGNEFGLGQISFALALGEVTGFGSLFNTTGIPMAEFVRYMPLCKRYGIDVLASLLSSCAVGNLFLPGHLTRATLSLRYGKELQVEGGYSDKLPPLMSQAARRLQSAFFKLRALLLPMSFTVGRPGADIHYACSMPMKLHPSAAQTTVEGAIAGLSNVHIVDGAVLPALSEKSHTLTLMANADRIGRRLAVELCNG